VAETCCFHEHHDPVTEEPCGNKCNAPAVYAIVWNDGRVSPACELHGIDALDDNGRALVEEIVPVQEYWS
jgi:hypothetical protein